MVSKIFIYLSILFFVIFYLSIIFFFRGTTIQWLDTNLPFRQSYFPSILGMLFVYAYPILFGIFAGYLFSSSKSTYVYYINLSLVVGILHFLPFLISKPNTTTPWFQNISIIYYLFLFPILFLVGNIPYYFSKNNLDEIVEIKKSNISNSDYLIALTSGLLIYALNIIPRALSPYLVGADIYYHAALSEKISSPMDIFRNPFFFGEKNYYYSIGYFLLSFLHKYTGADLTYLWMGFLPIFASIFIAFFILLAKRATNSTVAAIIAGLLILPFNQILWYDPSLRIISYGFFILFAYIFSFFLTEKKIIYLFFSFPFLLLTAVSHPEIAIHSVLIIFVYLIISFKGYFQQVLQVFLKFIDFSRVQSVEGIFIQSLNNNYNLLILISIYLVISATYYFSLLNNFSISKILIFNEIPLSALQPIGAISFITFLFTPIGIYRLLATSRPLNKFLLAIMSLFGTIIFYFSLLWILYHRYFAETAYFAMCIAASAVIASLLKSFSYRYRFLFFASIIGFLLVSIIPKYNFITVYSKSTQAIVQANIGTIELAKAKTDPDSVILINPDSILNRHIPYYADRYIFAGSSVINKEHQWQVLSFCNGPFTETCNKRLELSDNFFKNPSKKTLSRIKHSYKIDYLLIDNFSEKETSKLLMSDLNLNKYYITKNNDYSLYDLRKIKL